MRNAGSGMRNGGSPATHVEAPMNSNIERCERALAKFPDNAMARFSLGKAHFDLGDFEAARGQFALALAAKPDWMAVAILLGKCEQALGNKPAAKETFERALKLAIAQHHEGPQAELEQLLAESGAA